MNPGPNSLPGCSLWKQQQQPGCQGGLRQELGKSQVAPAWISNPRMENLMESSPQNPSPILGQRGKFLPSAPGEGISPQAGAEPVTLPRFFLSLLPVFLGDDKWGWILQLREFSQPSRDKGGIFQRLQQPLDDPEEEQGLRCLQQPRAPPGDLEKIKRMGSGKGGENLGISPSGSAPNPSLCLDGAGGRTPEILGINPAPIAGFWDEFPAPLPAPARGRVPINSRIIPE